MPAFADPNLLTRTLDWLKLRMARNTELASMSRTDLQLLATDIGVTVADLREVMPHVRDHSDLMDKMMLAHGLNPEEVRRAFVGLRDMERTCARCRDSGTCYRELKAGTAGARYHVFCANADAIDELLDVRA
jgi:hypothetical protein